MSNDDEWVEIPLTGRSLDKLVRETTADRATALRAAKAAAKHRVDMLALEYAEILMQKKINEALDEKTDPRLRRDLANDILNRGIGKVPEAESPDGQKKPDTPSAANILEMLAAMSAAQAIVEAARRPQLGHTAQSAERDVTPRLEDDSTTAWDVDALLDDIEGEKARE